MTFLHKLSQRLAHSKVGLVIGLAAIFACNLPSRPRDLPVPPAVVNVNPVAANVVVGRTLQLTATAQDANGNPLGGRVMTWATSNATVATVSASGLVRG